jgi:hypothetical protein
MPRGTTVLGPHPADPLCPVVNLALSGNGELPATLHGRGWPGRFGGAYLSVSSVPDSL